MRHLLPCIAALLAAVFAASPAYAAGYGTPAEVLGPILLLMVLMMPLKVAVAHWAIGDTKLRFIFAIVLDTAVCFYLLAPLTFLTLPLNLQHITWLLLSCGLAVFILAYSVDIVVLLLLSWGHRLEELLRATAIANAVTLVAVAGIGLFLWNVMGPIYELLVFIGRSVSLPIVPISVFTLWE